MSEVLSLRVDDEEMAGLRQVAEELGQTPAEMAAAFVKESLRARRFRDIEFRDTAIGRQPYLKGTRLAAWQGVWVVRSYDGDVEGAAESIGVPAPALRAALAYAAAYPEEIEAAIADNDKSPEELRRLIPNLRVFTVDASAP